MTRRLMVLAVTALVAMLALSGVAWAVVEPLTVTKTVPRSGATGIAPTANVKAYFDHDLRKATVTSTTFKIREKGTTAWLGATRTVNNGISPAPTNANSQSVATLNPDADLAHNTTYQVAIVGGASGVKGVDNQALETHKRWTFTTATAPPTAVGYAPQGMGGTTTNVTATFSAEMDPSTLTTSTFTLTRQGDSVPLAAQVTYDGASKTPSLNPEFDLSDSAHYTAVIKGGAGGVEDSAGNALAQDHSWTFMVCSGGIVLSSPGSIASRGVVVCG